ncbi:MAG: metallopeptidase, partial [Clostridia bacterium]|nr:metallopeptidase [Clostridia bacterium]
MENSEKLQSLANDILQLSRNTLLVHLRFLDMALSRLDHIPIETSTVMTDGQHIFYNPLHILRSYKTAKEIPVRDYLHIVMHCVFHHMYMDPALIRDIWDIACDIAVENILCDLQIRSIAAPREQKQLAYLNKIKSQMPIVTAEKLYAWIRQSSNPPQLMSELKSLFSADDHSVWYMQQEELASYTGYGLDNNRSDSYSSTAECIADWQKISERMQVDMETFGKQRGIEAGSLTQNLQAVNRERYDYTAFLKKFAVMGEQMRINDDEFDYVYYTYGLQTYGNMPLIEPLEYKDVKAIRDFVIAIDTSGSTSGELVQKFVQKTYNILKSTENFFSKINLHIIQCDADIQEDKKITCQEDFDEYLKTMQIRGLGGTDFRPVFEYVEQLRKNKEFTN